MDDLQQLAAMVPGMRKRVRDPQTDENCSLDESILDMNNVKAFETLGMIRAATQHLATADPRLAELITTIGPPERLLAKHDSCFRSLAKSILYQQLAGTAAAAIFSRFLAVCGVPDESQLTPAAVLSASAAALRGCGLSERKASYVLDLASHFQDGRLSDALLTSLSDDALLSTLTAVRGIGPWTVDMFSMFHLGRPNILPVGDLGVRKGLAHLCGLSHLPSPSEMDQLTSAWRPFRSLGCYYMWRIPLPPNRRAAAAAAARKRSSSSNKASSTSSQGAKKKGSAAVTAVLAGPLGAAAAAAAADVGVHPTAPLLAAASVDRMHVVTSTVQISNSRSEIAAAASDGGGGDGAVGNHDAAGAGALITDHQQQQQHLDDPSEQATPAKQQQQQQLLAASTAAVSGMVTRRRLKWITVAAQESAQQYDSLPPPAAAAAAGTLPASCDTGYRFRVVELG